VARRRHLRVAVAVEPTVLGDALVVCLQAAGFDDVVNLGPNPGPPAESFDAAVVTTDEVEADIVIDLREAGYAGVACLDDIVVRLDEAAREDSG
jgi:hypothetical protein